MGRRVRLAVLLSAAAGAVASAEPASIPDVELTAVFFIDKSHNRNQVVYGLALDRDCGFRTARPIQAFWRMRERGEGETEPLLAIEQRAYGLGPQEIIERRGDGGTVVVTMRAVPERELVFAARRAGERCEVLATTSIDGREAVLSRVYVKTWFLGVSWIALEGLADGSPVREVLR